MADACRRLERQADKRLAREHERADKEHSTVTIIGTLTSTIRRETVQWKPPQLEMPTPIDPAELKPIGIDSRGRQWYASSRYGELAERPDTLTDDSVLPDRLMLVEYVAGERTYIVLDAFAPGTFAHLGDARPVTPAPRPRRVVDGLTGVPFLETASGRLVRGPEAILARADEKGYTISLDTTGEHLVVAGARFGGGIAQLIDHAGPLLVAHLRGEPLTCTVVAHKKPAPAVSLTLGRAPVCAACLDRGR